MKKVSPKINFAIINYPSDKLTIKMMRDRFPTSFDTEPEDIIDRYNRPVRPFNRLSIDSVIAAIIDFERILAESAFMKGIGQHHPKSSKDIIERKTTLKNLSNDYIKFGLARGEHEAQQMLMNIEEQAYEQSRLFCERSQ